LNLNLENIYIYVYILFSARGVAELKKFRSLHMSNTVKEDKEAKLLSCAGDDHEWLRLTCALFELGEQLRPCVSAVMKEKFLPAVLADAQLCAPAFRDFAANVRVTVLNKKPPLPKLFASDEKWESNGDWWEVHEGLPSSPPFYVARCQLRKRWTQQDLDDERKLAEQLAIQSLQSRPDFASLDKKGKTKAFRDAVEESRATALTNIEAMKGYLTDSARTATSVHVLPSPLHEEYKDGDLLDRLWAELVLRRHKNGPLSALNPKWSNCNMSKWGNATNDPLHLGVWEMSKAFLGKLGDRNYAITKKLSEKNLSVDLLVNLMQYCSGDAFGCRLDQMDQKTLSRVNEIRNQRYGHIQEMKLSAAEAKQDIEHLASVLEMPGLADGLTAWSPTDAKAAAAAVRAICTKDMSVLLFPQLRVLADREAKQVRGERDLARLERDLALQKVQQMDVKLQKTDAKLLETKTALQQAVDELQQTRTQMQQENESAWADFKTASLQTQNMMKAKLDQIQDDLKSKSPSEVNIYQTQVNNIVYVSNPLQLSEIVSRLRSPKEKEEGRANGAIPQILCSPQSNELKQLRDPISNKKPPFHKDNVPVDDFGSRKDLLVKLNEDFLGEGLHNICSQWKWLRSNKGRPTNTIINCDSRQELLKIILMNGLKTKTVSVLAGYFGVGITVLAWQIAEQFVSLDWALGAFILDLTGMDFRRSFAECKELLTSTPKGQHSTQSFVLQPQYDIKIESPGSKLDTAWLSQLIDNLAEGCQEKYFLFIIDGIHDGLQDDFWDQLFDLCGVRHLKVSLYLVLFLFV
jgi:hypothetical protein